MGSFADYWENEILDHLFGKGSYTPPTIYVGLSTADPLDDASGLAEPSGNNYSRVSTVPGDWDAASGGATANASIVTFPEASGSWGACTYFAIFDDPNGGNMLAHSVLGVSKSITDGDTASFPVGELDVTLS